MTEKKEAGGGARRGGGATRRPSERQKGESREFQEEIYRVQESGELRENRGGPRR